MLAARWRCGGGEVEGKVEVVVVIVARQPITCCSYSLSIAMATFRATFVAAATKYHESELAWSSLL